MLRGGVVKERLVARLRGYLLRGGVVKEGLVAGVLRGGVVEEGLVAGLRGGVVKEGLVARVLRGGVVKKGLVLREAVRLCAEEVTRVLSEGEVAGVLRERVVVGGAE